MKKWMAYVGMILSLTLLAACGNGQQVKLDPKNPVTVTIWHYYNGNTMNAFDQLIAEFNEGVGAKTGIIVEGFGMGSVSDLEKAVLASAKKEVGSQPMPSVFASYADTAYAAEQLGILADLGSYFTADEQKQYLDSYMNEGRIGQNGELKIFPIAKSTEIFMLNQTDWAPFAAASGATYQDLSTLEGVARVAGLYYDWTDAQTPDAANDGKAFFGRDAMANLMIVGSKQLGAQIFQVKDGKATIHVDEAAMRRIWDAYYVPYISGAFTASGRYRSDDAKVGELIAYVGSTSSAAYFPGEVTTEDGGTRLIECQVLPVPGFEGGAKVLVQQGAGMVVTKGTPEQEYASAQFLKWFTDIEPNIRFSAMSGYLPVKKDASDYEKFLSVVEANQIRLDEVTKRTVQESFEAIQTGELYTNRAFEGGAAARSVLERSLPDKAAADRASILEQIAAGTPAEEAIATFNTDEAFQDWLSSLRTALNPA